MPDAAPPISSSDVSERRARSASQMAAFGDQPVTSSQAEDEHPAEDRGVAQTGPIEDLPKMARFAKQPTPLPETQSTPARPATEADTAAAPVSPPAPHSPGAPVAPPHRDPAPPLPRSPGPSAQKA